MPLLLDGKRVKSKNQTISNTFNTEEPMGYNRRFSIMKKIIICLLAICFGASLTVNAQSSTLAKQKAKQAKKEYKQKVKEYTKGGWQILGSSKTLEMALLDHYEALEKEGVSEITGYATSGSKNIAQDKLTMSACRDYAQMVSGVIRGKITEDMGSDISTAELNEFEHFYSAYENKLQTEIKGVLKPSFTIFRQTTAAGKKVFEFQRLFLLDAKSAHNAQLEALSQAAKETALAQIKAEQISKYLDEAFAEQ